MPRQRTARLPVFKSAEGRTDGPTSRGGGVFRARVVAIVLVLLSLALITVYFRESSEGPLHAGQRIGLSIVAPLEVAGERVARPFRDAYGWATDLLTAKEENERLREQVEALRRQVIQNQTAALENERLRTLLEFQDSGRFPEGYSGIATRVIGRPASPYNQEVLIAAGTADGVSRNDPVVTAEGLVGLVTEVGSNVAKVTLLTDQTSAVSAVVVESGAAGIVRHGPTQGATLVLDRVGKDELVEEGNLVISAGWKTGKLESLFPRGIPIGKVTGVGQQDVDLYKRIQVTPLVDFDSLSEVIVLVRAGGSPGP